MSEIEKMYKNAGIKKLLYCDICGAQEHALGLCAETECEPFYPPITAKKLINLEMFLIKKGDIDMKKTGGYITFESFTSCIAGLINNLWQSLTPEEKQQVKGILE